MFSKRFLQIGEFLVNIDHILTISIRDSRVYIFLSNNKELIIHNKSQEAFNQLKKHLT